jgi:hypothetical protein
LAAKIKSSGFCVPGSALKNQEHRTQNPEPRTRNAELKI